MKKTLLTGLLVASIGLAISGCSMSKEEYKAQKKQIDNKYSLFYDDVAKSCEKKYSDLKKERDFDFKKNQSDLKSKRSMIKGKTWNERNNKETKLRHEMSAERDEIGNTYNNNYNKIEDECKLKNSKIEEKEKAERAKLEADYK